MKQFKVAYDSTSTVPLQKVEAGMTLARSVDNHKGQLLVQEGETLSPEHLKKLNQFGIRRIVVEDTEEQWMVREEINELSGDAHEIVDERTVPDEQQPEPTPDSIKDWRTVLQEMESQARQQDLDIGSRLRDRITELYEHEEDVRNLVSRLRERVDDPETRRELEELVTDPRRSVERAMADAEVEDELLFDTIDVATDQDENREIIREITREVVGDGKEQIDPDQLESMNQSPEQDGPDPFVEVREAIEQLQQAGDDHGDEIKTLRKLLGQLEQLANQQEEIARAIHGEVDDPTAREALLDLAEGRTNSDIDREELRSEYPSLFSATQSQSDLRTEVQATLEETLSPEVAEAVSPRMQFDHRGPAVADDDARPNETDPEMSPDDVSDPLEQLENMIDQLDTGEEPSPSRQARVDAKNQRLKALRQQKNELEDVLDNTGQPDDVLEALMTPGEPHPEDLLSPESLNDELLDRISDYHKALKQAFEGTRADWESIHGGAVDDPFNVDSTVQPQPGSPEDLKFQSRSKKTNSAGVADDKRLEEQLVSAIENEDSEKLEQCCDLPEDFIESIFELYTIPSFVSGKRLAILRTIRGILWDILFKQHYNRDRLTHLKESLNELLDQHNRPMKFLINSSQPENYLLPHTFNTLLFSHLLLKNMPAGNDKQDELVLAIITKDIGLAALPEPMALRSIEPSPRVRREYSKHPLFSHQILARTDGIPERVEELARQHHERVDGSGYPGGSQPEEWPDGASIIQLATRYSALLEERFEQPSTQPNEAIRWLKEQMDQWNTGHLKRLERTIGHYPNGSILMISDGRMSLVREQNQDKPGRPKLLVLTDQNRNRLESPEPLDLGKNNSLNVKKLLKSA